MRFVEYESFAVSLKNLYAKGGPFKNAANNILAMRQKARDGYKFNDVFSAGLTHEGESRIPHCRKYNLSGRARLVTVVSNDICMFLFAGEHSAVDTWLDRNKNIDFIAKKQGAATVIEPVFVSASATPDGINQTDTNLAAPEFMFQALSSRYQQKLFEGLPQTLVAALQQVASLADDDVLLRSVDAISDETQKIAVLDVLLALRECDEVAAKNRVDLYSGDVTELAKLQAEDAATLKSGERVVFVQDVDQQLFEHFVRTADFQKWMLYLHPRQREYVDKDYSGPVRLAGVSGSGKTCVLIHRALRLAEKYPDEKVLILTLNSSLATLIEDLINASRGSLRPKNIEVRSHWQLCQEKLERLEPQNTKLYGPATVETNSFAISEHIEDIWDDFYNCRNNNDRADVMWPLHASLLARGVYPQEYLKQEFDYVRSAVAPSDRESYYSMNRSGRVVGLEQPFRKQVLEGLKSWEDLMAFVGAVDATGVATALYQHRKHIAPEYRCVLVDEVQDFGTLELAVIRRLVPEAENDIFLCGDAAQSVYTKFQDFTEASINLTGRYVRLNQNYRNSKQILAAAHDVLTKNFERCSKGFVDIDILSPEFANFASSSPLLLKAGSLIDEISFALGYCDEATAGDPRAKICIAVAGYGQRGVETLGKQLGLPVLTGGTNLHGGQVFLSDLEQTKGFEFDRVLVLNCGVQAIPHPGLPKEESFRDLSRLYVAMTRAKSELVISYHGEISHFIDLSSEHFVAADWDDYATPRVVTLNAMPSPVTRVSSERLEFKVTAREFLRMPEAVGLPANAQNKLLERVTGSVVFTTVNRTARQTTWRHLDEFLGDMKRPINRSAVHLSDEAWNAITKQCGMHEAGNSSSRQDGQ